MTSGGGERTSKAERQRRLRARQRRGEVVVGVAVSHDLVAALLDLGWLAEAASEDRAAIGEALQRLLADLATSQKNRDASTARSGRL